MACQSATKATRPGAIRSRPRAGMAAAAVAVAALLLSGAAAAAGIGTVVAASGTVIRTPATGAPELLAAGSALQRGDTVATQAKSNADLRYDDGTVVRLAASSRFTLPEYRFAPRAAGEDRIVARLLAGAMRVVTGVIAKRQPERAEFLAKTATIGIRGTDFSVRLCESECELADSATVARAGQAEYAGRVGGLGGGVIAVDAAGRVRRLAVSAPVNAGEIVAAMNGVAVLVMRDQTTISLDPGTALAIRAFRYDEATPGKARVELALLAGRVQVATGQLAKTHPERFRFFVGDTPVRVHGTLFGAAEAAASDAANTAGDAAQNAGNTAQNAANRTADAARNAADAGADAARNTADQAGQTGRDAAASAAGAGEEAAAAVGKKFKVDNARPSTSVADLAKMPAGPAGSIPVPYPTGPGVDAAGNAAKGAASDAERVAGTAARNAENAARNAANQTADAARNAADEAGQEAARTKQAVINEMREFGAEYVALKTKQAETERQIFASNALIIFEIVKEIAGQYDELGQQLIRPLVKAIVEAIVLVTDVARGDAGDPKDHTQDNGQSNSAASFQPVTTMVWNGEVEVAGNGPFVDVREGAVTVGSGNSAIRLNPGEMAAERGGRISKGSGRIGFVAPDPGAVSVASASAFFGQPAAEAGKPAAPGVYVSVNDGSVALAQGGREVVIARGEAAMAPTDGGPPVKVRNGVRVTGGAGLPAGSVTAGPGAPVCEAGPPAKGGAAPVATAAGLDLTRLPPSATIDARLDANAIDPTKPQGVGKGGGEDTGGGNSLGGNRFGPGFGGNTAIEDAAKNTGRNIGRGGLDGLQSNRVVTGRYGDTFAGNALNQGVDARNFGSGGKGDQVSDGAEGEKTLLSRMIDGYNNQVEQGGEKAGIGGALRGLWAGIIKEIGTEDQFKRAPYGTNAGTGVRGRPRGDDNPSGGGNGAPIYLGAGQFGNEIRGVGRAVGAKVGAAGGSGDGRTDQQGGGGDTGGPAMQRGEQLGIERAAASAGAINWDAALKINEVVNPTRQ